MAAMLDEEVPAPLSGMARYAKGGALGEGIDLLGGRIGTAVVIGPALPEVNALQEARRKMFEQAGAEDDDFHGTDSG